MHRYYVRESDTNVDIHLEEHQVWYNRAIPNNKTATVLKGVKAILQLYRGNGFTIEMSLMDGEFGTSGVSWQASVLL